MFGRDRDGNDRLWVGQVGVQRFGQAGQGIVDVGRFRHHRVVGCRRGHRQVALQDRDGVAVLFDGLALGKDGRGCFGRAEERLADELSLGGNRDEGHRVQPVRDGKTFRLGQSFAGDDGNPDRRPLARPVEHQIGQVIGRAAVQGGCDLAALFVAAGAGGRHLGIQHLAAGQDDLGRHPHRRQAKRGLAQVIQRFVQVGGIKRNLADRKPAFRRPVQQGDSIAGQIKGKSRFHGAGLARIGKARERAPNGWRMIKAAFRRKKGKRPRNDLRVPSQV